MPRGAATRANVDGVPFFVKKAKCREEVVWLEPIYNLSLSANATDKNGKLQPQPPGSLALSRSIFISQQVTNLIKLINEGTATLDTVQRYWTQVAAQLSAATLARQANDLPFQSDNRDLILIRRSSSAVPYVDYSDQFFLNARVPISGNANVATKLAADGTLTEGSAQIQNNTLQTILSAIPISSLFGGVPKQRRKVW